MSYEVQEHIIKLRPDLAGEIQDPKPELVEDYPDEFNLARIEI
jgi:hypothetical protein